MRGTPVLVALVLALAAGITLAAEPPVSGEAVPGFEGVDRAYLEFMARHQIPGGSVALMKNGRLVYSRAYGWSDEKADKPVRPDTLFRVASISKPVTALAISVLVQDGKLSYEQKIFPYLDYPTPRYPGAKRDPRLARITIRHLLQHSGGWDRETAINPEGNKGFDPMFHANAASRDLTGKAQPPAPASRIARWMVGKPLQFDPGTRYAYSNLGYCLLGRAIEKASGQDYERYVRSLLAKAGITSMHIGRGRLDALRDNETRYHDHPGAPRRRSVWGEPDTPGPYRFSIAAMDAHGGWIATARDLVRFTTLLDGRPEPRDLLTPATVTLTRSRPPYSPPAAEKRNYYGFGWSFWERPDGKFRNWFHSGSLPGTMSMLIRSDNGITWAALFNLRPKDSRAAFKDLDNTMWKAVRSVKSWPE